MGRFGVHKLTAWKTLPITGKPGRVYGISAALECCIAFDSGRASGLSFFQMLAFGRILANSMPQRGIPYNPARRRKIRAGARCPCSNSFCQFMPCASTQVRARHNDALLRLKASLCQYFLIHKISVLRCFHGVFLAQRYFYTCAKFRSSVRPAR